VVPPVTPPPAPPPAYTPVDAAQLIQLLDDLRVLAAVPLGSKWGPGRQARAARAQRIASSLGVELYHRVLA
jgi:hypothetical protein